MNILRNILFVAFFSSIIISCNNSNESSNKESSLVNSENSLNITNKESLFHAKVIDFVYNIHEENEDLNILTIEISQDMYCSTENNLRLCDAVQKYINGNNIVFSASEEFANLLEKSNKFRMQNIGIAKIGENKYDAQLYYSTLGDENIAFYGTLAIQLPMLDVLDKEPLLIDIKGKKN